MESAKNALDEPVTAVNSAAARTNFRWIVIGLAFLITLVNYFDRSAISYAIGPIKHDFNLSDSQFGYIGAAFGIGYMIMTVGGGILVDKYGSHKIWSAAAILWSTCTALMALASGFWPLFFLRSALGIAEGPHFPSLGRVISDWLPASERARATAAGLVGVPLAQVIGAPLLSHLITGIGWRITFIFLGSLGLIWSLVWLGVFTDYPEKCDKVSDEELKYIREGVLSDRTRSDFDIRKSDHAAGGTTWRTMLFNKALFANNLAFFSFGYLAFFGMIWFPGYLEETYKLKLTQVGWFTMAPWLVAAILMPVAGWLSDLLYQRTGSYRIARSHQIWICQLLSALCFIPVIFSHSLLFSITMISLGMGLGMMPNAAFYALNYDIARDKAGTSLGIMDCFFAAAGIAAPALTGTLAQVTGGFAAAFGLLVVLTLSSVAAVLFLQRDDREQAAPVS
ncbi:MAG TPA: MFS transporter [Planktothrix sp.]|jgi:MFS family permease